MIEHISRRSAMMLSVVSLAAPPLMAWGSPAVAAGVPTYGPDEGSEIAPGVRVVEVGTADSEMSAYKGLQIVDVVFQPGAADIESVMDSDMVCYILAGEFTIQKSGGKQFTVKEGDVYTCGKGKTDHAINTSSVVGIHRVAILQSA